MLTGMGDQTGCRGLGGGFPAEGYAAGQQFRPTLRWELLAVLPLHYPGTGPWLTPVGRGEATVDVAVPGTIELRRGRPSGVDDPDRSASVGIPVPLRTLVAAPTGSAFLQ